MDELPDQAAGEVEVQRAEEMVDAMGRMLADTTSHLTRQILRGVALAREEAEDIWAEARSGSRQP